MIIRAMELKDFEEVDKLMKQLHQVHVNGRPDLFVPLEHPYSAEKFSEMINDSEVISILAEENGKMAAYETEDFAGRTTGPPFLSVKSD